jgi:hypothetical protein
MNLPGRLRDTTLGDVLGTLFRHRVTGYLELIDAYGLIHRVEIHDGLIAGIESPQGPRLGQLLGLEASPHPSQGRLGEQLLARGLIEEEQLEAALKYQILQRLELLFELPDAAIRFRVPRPRDFDRTAPAPLSEKEFLVGRRRSRGGSEGAEVAEAQRSRRDALRVLGLRDGASPSEVRAAFRELAAKYHPDRHRAMEQAQRTDLFRKFAEISRAYHSLSA